MRTHTTTFVLFGLVSQACGLPVTYNYGDCGEPSGCVTNAAPADTDSTSSSEMSCADFTVLAVTICGDAGVVELNCTELTFACDTDGDGSGDVNIENNNTNENNNSNSNTNDNEGGGGDDDSGADDDDTGDGGGDTSDLLGSYGCVHPYDSAMQAWLTANGTPANLVLDDSDSDGNVDQVWTDGVLEWDEIGLLDLDGDGNVDDSSWSCTSWPDGTSDSIDNDGDGYSELEGDYDDGTGGNMPGAVDACGDAVDNDYDGSLDEECESDSDSDGENELEGDCNDDTTWVGIGAYEYSNGEDDDCDGTVDELNCPSNGDSDGDGYYEDADCDGTAETGDDCNDAAASINPGATDYGGDGNDDDCDGTDE